ncbi:MAG: indolepyruvate ferredoxin oxidoreductase subunit alpha [Lachnospiraceae bacterium]|nr:indolepyruvate ferredoxin oxidoreductase subunit alpha [Lachnospiraceae bacterium]
MSKKLMLGNEAAARGLYEAGCEFVSSYPGTPSTEITEFAAKYDDIYAEWAPNEKVAMESAFGASFAGKRSFCGMKHVGLNVAADPLFTLSYTGVNAGLIIGVADDPGMHSSQNEQDSRHYAIASKVPMLEPSDSAESKEYTKLAFELSEKFDTPVILKMCTRVAHCQGIVELEDRDVVEDVEYVKDPQKYIMTPANAIKKHPLVEERLNKLREWAEGSDINRIEEGTSNEYGFITSSTSYNYVKEVFGDKYPVLKIGLINPLPNNTILNFASKVNNLVVVEELDGIIETHCHTLGLKPIGKDKFTNLGEFSQTIVANAFGIKKEVPFTFKEELPARPPALCAGCPHRGIFYVLHNRYITVHGDIGCYTLGAMPPLNALDSTVCMGASVSGLHGFNKVAPERANNTVAVIGDSTFMHSGVTGLINIAYNESNSTVIILDNSITGMTGHQQNPTTGINLKGDPAGKVCLEDLCKSIGIKRVRVIDPYDIKKSEQVIIDELDADEPSVIISRRPCALLKNVKHPGPIKCDTEKCVGCKACMRIGCPAISMVKDKAFIDETLCVGCGVCGQMCKMGALPLRKEADND